MAIGKLSFECFLCCYCFTVLLLAEFSHSQSAEAANVLTQGQELRSGSQLISATGNFVLGFYSPSNSNTSYLGISYNTKRQKPVWIANRHSPFPNNSDSTILTIDGNGSLKIVGKGKDDGYSFSLFDVQEPTSSSAILQDDGNFVLRELNPDGSIKQVLWQSFDNPTDTLLPGMKLGINHKTGSTWSLTSWRSEGSPKLGTFTLKMNPNNTNQLLMLFQGAEHWMSGNWKDGSFEYLEVQSMNSKTEETINFNRVSNENETYFIYFVPKFDWSPPVVTISNFYLPYSYPTSRKVLPKLRIEDGGTLEMNNQLSYSVCPDVFENENPYVITKGCVWKKQNEIPECRNSLYGKSYTWASGYMEGSGSKYKESENLTLFECKNICINDCDCIAYDSTNEDGSGCEIWKSGGAEFTSSVVDGRRQVWYLQNNSLFPYRKGKMKVWLQVTIGLIIPTTFLLLCFIFYVKWRTQIFKVIRKIKKSFLRGMKVIAEGFTILGIMIRQIRDGKKNPELQFFDFESIVSATNNFADEYKLGKGGFGPVYKGILADGQEVAIKRLSKNSGQGLVEFKNETILIAKLQHTNLVRLIGCCIHKEEKLLVYEYMPNKSLDFFIFDSEKKLILDWDKRLHIIQGIVQGLLYLHNYSRVRIIHRDLKVSNILLDDEMNAKISDFGMARVFKPSEHEANTSRVVGTYGYISPEYAMEGIFSIKSDVYSFGILLLEIITSKKNYNNYNKDRPLNLIGYAWELWVNGRGEELIDSGLCNSEQKPKALRCIHVSLLCVQQIAADRPTMLDVYFMINNDSTQLPSPKHPAFFVAQSPHSSELEAADDNGVMPAEPPVLEIGSLSTMSLSVMVAR